MLFSVEFSDVSFKSFLVVELSHRPFLTAPGKSRGEPRSCLALRVVKYTIFENGTGKREREEKKNVCLDVFGERPHEVLTG